MFFRYFVALCLVALCAVAIHADVDFEEDDVNSDVIVDEVVDRANPAAKAVAKILGGLFASAAGSCLWEAAEKCKSHWKNPHRAVSCGKNFLKNNKGRCAAGR